MKINKKVIITTLIMALTLIVISNTVLAATFNATALNNSKDIGDEAVNKIEDIGSRIFTAVSNVGVVLSVIMVAIIGVKYMLGSVEERAEYKKTMMPYLIGAVLIFMASTIGKIVYTVFSKL